MKSSAFPSFYRQPTFYGQTHIFTRKSQPPINKEGFRLCSLSNVANVASMSIFSEQDGGKYSSFLFRSLFYDLPHALAEPGMLGLWIQFCS